MKMIVFNSIQVINYWFTQHCTLRPLYQQAQTFSLNIWGISDQNVTLWTFLQYKNDNSAQKLALTSQVNLQGLQQTIDVLKVPALNAFTDEREAVSLLN
jgi:hypothetical protein